MSVQWNVLNYIENAPTNSCSNSQEDKGLLLCSQFPMSGLSFVQAEHSIGIPVLQTNA
jgi:hypothetical protein